MFPLGSRQATLSHSPAGGLSSNSGISVGLRRLRSLPRITRAVLRSWPSHGVLGLPDERSGQRPVLWVSPTFPALCLQSFRAVPRSKGGRHPRSRRVSSAIRPCMDVNKALCLGTPRNLRPLYFFPRRHYVGGLRAHALREAVGEGRPVFPNLARAAHASRATHRPAGVSCVRSRSLAGLAAADRGQKCFCTAVRLTFVRIVAATITISARKTCLDVDSWTTATTVPIVESLTDAPADFRLIHRADERHIALTPSYRMG